MVKDKDYPRVVHVDFVENVTIYRNGKFIYSDNRGTVNKIKMTREDAIRIVRNNVFGLTDTGQAEKWISTLQALGLIKFDEPELEPELDEKISLKLNRSISTEKVNDVLNMIEHLGYNISKRKYILNN